MADSDSDPAARTEVHEALDAEMRSEAGADALRLALDGVTTLLNAGMPSIAARHDGIAFADGSSATLDVMVPGGDGPHPVLVYFHGGAWVAGSPASHRKLTARFVEAGFLVLSVDYRLAPEHPFPAGFEDCLAAVPWAAENAGRYGGDPARLTLGGDSAGANLAAAVAVTLGRRQSGPRVRAVALMYGVFDLRDMGNARANRSIHRAYLPGELIERLDDPRVSPIHAAAALPPSFVVVGRKDPLLEQSRRLCEALREAGIVHEYVEAAGMPHGFMQMEFLGGVRRLVGDIARFLDTHTTAEPAPPPWWRRLATAVGRWISGIAARIGLRSRSDDPAAATSPSRRK